MKTFTRFVLVGFAGAAATAAPAQVSTNNLATTQTNQSLAGVAVGNGMTQSTPVATVNGSSRPQVGLGVLSASPDHYGSTASVSAANTERLLGVDGAGGPGSANSVSVSNPKKAPVLAGSGK